MKKSILIFSQLFFCFYIFAQNSIKYNGTGNYILIEKTDLRRYDNGKYTGLESREISSYITPIDYENGYLYEGNFYVWQDVHRESYSLTGGIQDVILSKFSIDENGSFKMILDNGYPSFRSFPSFPIQEIKIGDKWQAKAERAVDPLNKGIVTKMPIFVEYTYIKDEVYNDELCYVLSAQWATRYGIGNGSYNRDWGGDKELDKATGTNKATLYISKESGNALLIRDYVDETYFYTDGSQVQFKGTISQFTEYPPTVNHTKLLPALKRISNISPELEKELLSDSPFAHNKKIEVTQTPSEKLVAITNDENFDNQKLKKDSQNNGSLSKDNYSENNYESTSETEFIQNNNEKFYTSRSNTKKAESIESSLNNTNLQNKQNDEKTLITVENTECGIKLTINDLHFIADSSELLKDEKNRLDQIAEVLKQVPDNQLLIEGHTASTGKEQGELQLSLERAHAIAQALINRGIEANRIICKGSGGKKPIADNLTPEGKAKNRRVEITILE